MSEVRAQSEIGTQIRRLRKAKDWTVAQLAVYADMSPSAVSQIETGRRSPTAASMAKLAGALGVEVRDLFPLGQAPLPDFEEARPAAEPLPPKLRRFAAERRRTELKRSFQHLTLRSETLRVQAQKSYEAGDPEGLWRAFMDCFLLVRGTELLLAENREEAEEIGGETKEERRLRGRLEHRTEDLVEVGDKIKDMWAETSHAARADAEHEAPRETIHNEDRPPEHDNVVRGIFQRSRAG